MDTIKSLGDRLRQERERQGLTIEDIAQKTYIRKKYLEAIESGDHSDLPGEVYVKGFLRSYAEALGLNGWDFVAEYNRLIGAKAEDKADQEAGTTSAGLDSAAAVSKQQAGGRVMQNPIMLPAKQKYLRNKSKQDRRLIGVIALVLVLVVLYVVLVPNGVEAPGTEQTITETILPSELPEAAESSASAEAVEPDTTDTSTAAAHDSSVDLATAPTVALPPVHVLISAHEDCWLEVYADGKLIYTGIITPGSRYEAQGEQKVQIRFGNPGGVTVVHNGKAVGNIGRQVHTRVFTPDTHYIIADVRREERPRVQEPEPARNEPVDKEPVSNESVDSQPELAGFSELDEN